MPTFHYAALDRSGSEIRGRVAAVDLFSAVGALRQRGLWVVRISRWRHLPRCLTHQRSLKEWSAVIRAGLPLGAAHQVFFLRHLALGIAAGISIVDALGSLEQETENPRLARMAQGMRAALLCGTSLSAAMARHGCFSVVAVTAVEGAEAGGDLSDALEHATRHIQRTSSWRQKLITALSYPVSVAVLSGVMVAYLVFKILPQFLERFVTDGQAPSDAAQRLMTTLRIAQGVSLGALLSGGFVLSALTFVYATGRGRRVCDSLILRLPLVRRLVLSVCLSRVCSALSALLEARIPLAEALPLAAGVAGNDTLDRCFRRCGHDLFSGRSLCDSLRTQQLPLILQQAVTAGEQTGNLGRTLGELGEFYNQDATAQVGRVVALTEPILMLCIVVVVGFFVVTIYTATLQLRATLGS